MNIKDTIASLLIAQTLFEMPTREPKKRGVTKTQLNPKQRKRRRRNKIAKQSRKINRH